MITLAMITINGIDTVFQIRYWNPKSRDFYFHGVTPVSASGVDPSKTNFLVGEPEFYVYPTPDNFPTPEVPPGFHDYINAYPHHHAVRQHVCLSVYLSICLSVSLFVCWFVSRSTCLCFFLCQSASVCLFLCFSF
jgi:hypothetical protein